MDYQIPLPEDYLQRLYRARGKLGQKFSKTKFYFQNITVTNFCDLCKDAILHTILWIERSKHVKKNSVSKQGFSSLATENTVFIFHHFL
jgi:hypothetical protein